MFTLTIVHKTKTSNQNQHQNMELLMLNIRNMKMMEMNNDLFQAGKATYLEIITAQQSLLSAQLNEVSDTFQRMQAVINLYSALGGGRE